MNDQRLLSFLVAQMNRAPEPTATAALTFILSRSPQAASALVAFARQTGVPVPTELRFVSELGVGGEGRPDITGLQRLGHEDRVRLIVEAKFDARLLDLQVPNYVARFRPDAPAVMVLLAPENRLPSLWSEALAQLPDGAGQGANAPAPAGPAASATYVHPYGEHAVTAVSWDKLMTAIQLQVDASGDADIASDVRQLRSLVNAYERQTFVPFLSEDLDLRVAKTFAQTLDLFWNLRDTLSSRGMPAPRPVASGHEYYRSHHVTPRAAVRCRLVRATDVWLLTGISPLYVEVEFADAGLPKSLLLAALAPLGEAGGPGVLVNDTSARVPLHLPRNCGRDAVLAGLVAQVERVASLLDVATPDDSPQGVPSLP
jgi:hypothetical protein